ncbi:MAG: SUMF1/EgtB/PvdO family nonheme iron enzyme [Polyangiaceae bacterium]
MALPRSGASALFAIAVFAAACRDRGSSDTTSATASETTSTEAPSVASPAPPLPSSGAPLEASERALTVTLPPPPPPKPRCPADMVLVKDSYCVDRYESYVVDNATNMVISPYYPPEPGKAAYIEKIWLGLKGGGTDLEQSTPLPPLPALQKQKSFQPRALNKKGMVPQGYASGKDAALACKNAGKRLCTRDEWHTACRGDQDRDFPYGDKYVQGVCNIFRENHPGFMLWDNPSINHTDPRFNLMKTKQGPLLRVTGATLGCISKWGSDAIYDMVGNIDEWIDDPEGTFVGGFYARGKKDGCQSAVTNHPYDYADYSTGIRCCADATLGPPRDPKPPDPKRPP